jgi:hypothetical protein
MLQTNFLQLESVKELILSELRLRVSLSAFRSSLETFSSSYEGWVTKCLFSAQCHNRGESGFCAEELISNRQLSHWQTQASLDVFHEYFTRLLTFSLCIAFCVCLCSLLQSVNRQYGMFVVCYLDPMLGLCLNLLSA